MPPKRRHYNIHSRDTLESLERDELINVVLQMGTKLQELSDIVRDLISAKYDRKTERFEDAGQMKIFPAPAKKAKAEPKPDAPAAPKKAGHSRNPIPENLPRVPIHAKDLPEAKRLCECCGAKRVVVREILQHSRLQYQPASFYVEDLMALVFACPNCKEPDELAVKVSEPVENGIAGSGLLAEIAVSRGVDHLPFNRQSAIYARSGVSLSRSTLSDLFAHTAGILRPLIDFMHGQILKAKIIWTDDTPVKVQDRTKDKNIKTGRIWIYIGDDAHPFNLFDYTIGRGRDGPLAFLKDYKGFLQGDCFSGNLAVCRLAGTTLVACLAHARRYFIKAMLNDKEGCNEALSMFQALYEIERTAKELALPEPEVKLIREQEAVPLLNELHSWLQEQYAVAQPKSSFGKALFYCLNNWNELIQYVADGELSIDNNCSEREMKYVAMGRKAWLFLGSDEGGKNHAVVLSLLSTCRRHGVEPWAYLTDVIERLSDGSAQNLEDLLPHRWKPLSIPDASAEIPAFSATPKMQENMPISRKADQFSTLPIAI